jgi:catechol 2,3-dioxygenase-like lactoylglutathione lyase family enzyme
MCLHPGHNHVMRKSIVVICALIFTGVFARAQNVMPSSMAIPDTGISGVYEVVAGFAAAQPALDHFALFGFHEVARAELSAEKAQQLYGVKSKLLSLRLQNGDIDSHGLLRIFVWAQPLGPGVGYAPPETVGQRLAVMMTADVFRIDDVFTDARTSGAPWLPIKPVFADLFGQTQGKPDLFQRRIGVRESGVYGEIFNHVFFQRYGYSIPGYGTLNLSAPLKGSEFTHHDFIINSDIALSTNYYRDVLGFKAENDGVIDGDWLEGPKRIFGMADGGSHFYRGFVSPNNICGKLKFFRPRDVRSDRSNHQRVGELGITMHTLYTPRVGELQGAVMRAGLRPTKVTANEFGEASFRFTGPDGATWQILSAPSTHNTPLRALEMLKTDPPATTQGKK